MKGKKIITKSLIKAIETMAQLEVDEQEEDYFVGQFNETLNVVGNLDKVDTSKTSETNQVTGLSNVYREDIIDLKRILSQKEALKNSGRNFEGFFVVKAVFEEK